MHTFQIKLLIQFFVSSICVEHHVFIIRKTICYMQILWYVFHAEVTIKGYICGEEKPTRCHLMIYCSYELFYMFRALICPSSGA
jgi:hypothetical protein